ncbi:TPR Domain containing protein [Coccidioides posadasii C735 delta SOWgp]|uniref:TPR Domain containing protein n=1 Tax=Coccidioides posadasii (strain C735) TaxID=222929 RepID=C5P4I2_COCP7|nr:TPR Domain containing protein [Coccidioides posadasii C735 delta SOWgp]EER27622.1 TPR Domain containing protein [Coccidioides posadasii C735 delta SOWgp]|eukprot:XP_003069767.1 TPR Domain containing protein [Coccidioides posadasii C735 delta SOWgp]
MEDFLRNWRQEALNRGQHDAAIYIGDKVLAFTSDDNDAFWLAQVHFSNNNYTRALALLTRKDLIFRSSSCKYLAAHCYIKQNKYDQALQVLGEHNPAHLISTASNSRRKLQHRNESSHITLRNGKSTASRSDRIERNEEREREDASHIKFEAAMCYLRGLCYARQNAFDRARDCYKDAVRIDIQCFEAFEQLMKNSLMSPAEELEFLESLDFDSMNPSSDPSISQEAAEFVKLLYTTRLSKYSSPSAISHATETLSTHYNLAENPDLLLSRAETLYTQCRFPEALQLTSSILSSLDSDSMSAATSQGSQSRSIGHSPSVYPLHLACLYETGATNSLFLLAHTLADNAPEESYTYLAIGVYYLSVSKIAEARRFFSKASLLDPHSAPAWIGFAHTFAAEGEHDQAIAAYSTAARLFQGSHLPQLFLGMQHLALNNMSLAHEYLSAAYNMSSGSLSATSRNGSFSFGAGNMQPPPGGDPLVLNEVGVVLYHQANLEGAIEFFRRTLALAASLQCDPGAWSATRANLGHALRRLGSFEEALVEFDECLRIGAGGSTTGYTGKGGVGATLSAGSAAVGGYEDRGLTGSLHTARGLVLLELGRTMEAVTTLHEAVRVLGTSGGDAAAGAGVAGTLLSRALEIWALEEGDRDAAATASEHIETDIPTKSRPTAAKGKDVQKAKSSSRIGSRTRSRKTPLPAQEWTDDVINRESPNTPGGQRPASMELDDDADGLLNNALARIKSRHATRQRDVGLGANDQAFDTPEPSQSTRATRATSRRKTPVTRGPPG